jgi:RND family efflux transporter MFP subunit
MTGLRGSTVALAAALTAASASAEQRFDCVMDPADTISVGAPTVGLLDEVSVDRGDHVTKGQILARLQSGVEAANVALDRKRAENNAEVELRQFQMQLSQHNFERTQSLYKKQVASEEKLDEMRTELEVNAHAVELAKLARDTAQLELQRSEELLRQREIKSPVDGIVTERLMSGGEYARPESIVLKIVQLDPIHVEVFLPVRLYPRVRLGMIASVEPEAPISGRFDAKVTVIDHVFDVASGTFGVRLAVPNADGALPGGHRCQVVFPFPDS